MDKDNQLNSSDSAIENKGFISAQLMKDGITNESLGVDHIGIEIISVKPENLYETVSFLKN